MNPDKEKIQKMCAHRKTRLIQSWKRNYSHGKSKNKCTKYGKPKKTKEICIDCDKILGVW